MLLYDDHCTFCSRLVNFAKRNSLPNSLEYIGLRSTQGKEILCRLKFPKDYNDSIVFVDKEEKVSIKSQAVFKVISTMNLSFRILLLFKVVPKYILDKLYDKIAKSRKCKSIVNEH